MIKVKIGDEICSNDFGPGKIVAMTNQWCIFVASDGCEFALPWDEVFVEAQPSEPQTHLHEREISA